MGKRWLSDYEIDKVFNVVNEVYDNTIGFVCKPTHVLYSSSGLHEKNSKYEQCSSLINIYNIVNN